MKRQIAIAIAGVGAAAAVAGMAGVVSLTELSANDGPKENIRVVALNATEPAIPEIPDPTLSLPPLPKLPKLPLNGAEDSPSMPSPAVAPQIEKPSDSASKTSIDSRDAMALVATAASGTAIDVSRVEWNGVASWAVMVERADGSIVTGYVAVVSGVIHDWEIVRAAPTAPANQGGSSGGGGQGTGNHGDDEGHDEDEDEHEDEHEDEDEDEHEDEDD